MITMKQRLHLAGRHRAMNVSSVNDTATMLVARQWLGELEDKSLSAAMCASHPRAIAIGPWANMSDYDLSVHGRVRARNVTQRQPGVGLR